MPVKFKLGFTIDAETLFGIMSKFLPVENLVVEELAPMPDPAIRFDKRFDLPKPKRAPQVRKTKGSGYAMNLHAGGNAIIMAVFSDGEEHSVMECSPGLKAAGYSTNGTFGRFERLKRHGVLVPHGRGRWKLTPKGKELWEHPPRAARENAA
jgi:hypothetical protein